jgi:hypothetical protein
MNFEADFHDETGDVQTITGQLTGEDLQTVDEYRTNGKADPYVVAMVLALRHAYKTASEGWQHVAGGVRLTWAN